MMAEREADAEPHVPFLAEGVGGGGAAGQQRGEQEDGNRGKHFQAGDHVVRRRQPFMLLDDHAVIEEAADEQQCRGDADPLGPGSAAAAEELIDGRAPAGVRGRDDRCGCRTGRRRG